MKIVPIEKSAHQQVKISSTQGHAHAANQNLTTVVAAEIGQAALNFPVVLTKDSRSGRFFCTALFGLAESENLIYNDHSWDTTYIPMSIKRVPFVIGESNQGDGSLGPCIDEESQYISNEGEALFDKDGNKTAYLKKAESYLATLYEHEVSTQHFVNKITELKLIVPLTVQLTTVNRGQSSLSGLYTISEEKLRALPDENSLDLFRRGYLSPIYGMIISLGQVNRLVSLRNKRAGDLITSVQIKLNTD